MFFMYVVICVDIIIVTYHTKKNAHRSGRTGSNEGAFLGCHGFYRTTSSKWRSAVKRAVVDKWENYRHRQNYTAMVLSITVLRRDEIVAVVPPPAGSASSGDVTPSRKHSFLKLNDLASSRAHSRNYHNGKSTDERRHNSISAFHVC